ncbi:hypothetical protein ACPRNU_10040, partial [Chromobacterium vaccinii]|uniref:hypothetical protein n=1 Tax=Chromobacterium vaccinii TaxID=1108595 RepID=UPI003C75F97E
MVVKKAGLPKSLFNDLFAASAVFCRMQASQQAICRVVRLGLGITKAYALRLASGLLAGLRCSEKDRKQAL